MESLKSLKEMTLEELWQLFPISLVPYNPIWKVWATEEIELLQKLLGFCNPVISHIGSTAIEGIYSKPTVDILVETPDKEYWDRIVPIMEFNGYILMSRNERRISFNKGYTEKGYAEKVFHIHFRLRGDRDEVIFRDYLNAHPSLAKEYEALKKSLIPEYKYNRDAYTEAKSNFIYRIMSMITVR